MSIQVIVDVANADSPVKVAEILTPKPAPVISVFATLNDAFAAFQGDAQVTKQLQRFQVDQARPKKPPATVADPPKASADTAAIKPSLLTRFMSMIGF